VGAYRACGAGECLKVHRRYVEEWVTNVATVQVPGTKNWEPAMSLDESAAGNLNGNWRNLGTIWLVYGNYRVIIIPEESPVLRLFDSCGDVSPPAVD
jgi:hypothetical protein